MIAIIDYGMGNLRSVQKGFEHAGFSAEIVNDPQQVRKAKGVVLPGVGAFRDAMDNLREAGMIEVIQEITSAGKPFLGICLGMQLLFETSEEWGLSEGLGLIQGAVRKFPSGLKIPHMGWNQVQVANPSAIIEGINTGDMFYFVHSYYVDPVDPAVVTTSTEYGMQFTSIVSKDNVFGIQFHPEKSSSLGLKILKNFGELVSRC